MLRKLSTLPLLVFIVFVQPFHSFAQQVPQQPSTQPPQWYGPGPWHGPWHGSGFWWICPLLMLVIFFIVVVFFFGRRHHWGPGSHMMNRGWEPPTHSALQILNERFARGEIEKDEYEEKKAAILSGERHQGSRT